MQRVTASLIAAGLLAVSGTAFADGDDAAGAPPATAAPVTAPAPSSEGAIDQNDRSLVTPKGAAEIHGTLPIFAFSEPDPTVADPGATSTTTAVSIAVGVTYGAADKLEVGVDYSHGISPSDGNGVLNAHAAYLAMHSEKLDIALAADLSFDLSSNGDYTLGVGGWVRYHVAPKVSIFTGNPGLPHTALLDGVYQLQFGLNNGNAVSLSLPVGVGFQATPEIWAFATTTIADFAISGGGSNAFLFSDFIPIGIGAFYQVNPKLDVGVEFDDNLKDAGDAYAFVFNARYWVK